MTKLNLPQTRMEQIVFVDCMNLNGSKNPNLFIDYHGNRYRVTVGDYKLTNECLCVGRHFFQLSQE